MMSAQASSSTENTEVEIRAAVKEDMSSVAQMIQDLADFEKMPNGPQMTVRELERDGFEANPPAFKCKVAVLKKNDVPTVIGYAIFFPTYSTWEGRSMMLEDLYVIPSERRNGVGRRLFNSIAEEAFTSGSNRLDFHVLEWNPARSFYERRGAVNLTRAEHWCYYRLAGEALYKASLDEARLKTNFVLT
ncbi:hypothetical protein ACJJTC_005672 [Scirpophaga incertulas]